MPRAPSIMSQQGITLYHIKNTRSLRILWLLEELGLSYEVKEYERGADFFAPEELKKVHPLGKIPILIDGEDTIAESGTIVEYLISKYGGENLKPKDSEWLDNTYFTHYSEGTLMPLLQAYFALRSYIFSYRPAWSFKGNLLSLTSQSQRRDGTNSGSEIDKYIQRVHERPAYKRAIEKGGRIDYAALLIVGWYCVAGRACYKT
ncbi:glutathione S-transferase [Pyrrhoderma noxium]|uniref:glutathione transferase n=1 Tax=Pyrrhoderma noxium TaxID=2282107 RepID=A0A286UHX1_9AGAM|nr:glutathione S-transferase [Pyrrhoderma noxium]